MSSFKKIAGKCTLILLGLTLLTACGGQGGEPTPDANAIFTAAAETVSAQLSQTAAAQPTSTNTSQPTATNTIVPTKAAQTLTLPSLPGPAGTLPPLQLPGLATATRAPVATGDKCEYVGQFPPDGTEYKPNQVITEADWYWDIKNIGTTTWTKEYKYRFYSGDLFTKGGVREYSLRQEVKPGETAHLIYDPSVPSSDGSKNMNWVLTNKDGINFCTFYALIKVTGNAPAITSEPAKGYDYMCTDPDRAKKQNFGCRSYCAGLDAGWYATTGNHCYYLAKGGTVVEYDVTDPASNPPSEGGD